MSNILLGQALAWLAGLLEGEGCFCKTPSPRISLAMTDRDVVERAAVLMENAKVNVHRPARPHYKTQYVTVVSGHRAIRIMLACASFMGDRRSAKIDEIVDWWESKPRKREPGFALCHPDRRARARGLCENCYRAILKRERPETHRRQARIRSQRWRAKKQASIQERS